MNGKDLKLLTLVLEAIEPGHKELGYTRKEFRALSRELWEVWAEHVKNGRPKIVDREIPIVNSIVLYWHCALCMQTKPDDQSMWMWGEYQGGWTPLGFQLVCKRHGINVMHVDFEGQQHRSEEHAPNVPKILIEAWGFGGMS